MPHPDGPRIGHELAARDGEGDLIEGSDRAEALADPCYGEIATCGIVDRPLDVQDGGAPGGCQGTSQRRRNSDGLG